MRRSPIEVLIAVCPITETVFRLPKSLSQAFTFHTALLKDRLPSVFRITRKVEICKKKGTNVCAFYRKAQKFLGLNLEYFQPLVCHSSSALVQGAGPSPPTTLAKVSRVSTFI